MIEIMLRKTKAKKTHTNCTHGRAILTISHYLVI